MNHYDKHKLNSSHYHFCEDCEKLVKRSNVDAHNNTDSHKISSKQRIIKILKLENKQFNVYLKQLLLERAVNIQKVIDNNKKIVIFENEIKNIQGNNNNNDIIIDIDGLDEDL